MKDTPKYTKSEEIFNMVSHIVGGGLGFVALIFCVIIAAYNHHRWGVVGGIVYGLSAMLLFTMSSVYHGLPTGRFAKRVFRVLDHCTIFVLIAGTYTPILLGRFREVYPIDAWVLFGLVWTIAIVGIVLNAVSLRRFMKISLIMYLALGWVAVFRINRLLEVLGPAFFVLIGIGGVLYSVGAIFYVVGRKKKYMHSVFHIFVVAASVIHSVAIALFIMP
ncbi:MAG: hemolysin III family protein [Defluviitaleaceae bacterium]|nr:hemolysin III family protein [Defluviitaleaceae bacterium]